MGIRFCLRCFRRQSYTGVWRLWARAKLSPPPGTVFDPSRDVYHTDNRKSKVRVHLHANKKTSVGNTTSEFRGLQSPPLLPQCWQNLAKFSLASRQFALYLFLASKRLRANTTNQMRADLPCLGGACSSRTRGVPRLLFRTGRGMATLLGCVNRHFRFDA